MPGSSNSTKIALLPFILAVVWILPEKLERRDAALNIQYSRVPIPENGRLVTIQHSQEEVEKFVYNESDRESLLIAPQADIYYEAHYTDSCTKHFVILEGTNSQTWVYRELLNRMRELGFCTLVFDWRAHGRSEDTPGDITSELFMLDAARIIQHVFPDQQVHVLGWSLGGFVGYQLAIYKPQLVKSLVVYGSNSCFSPIPEGSTECKPQWNPAQFFFSRGFMMRLLGLKVELSLAQQVLHMKAPISEILQQMFYSLRMEQKVKTPSVWLQLPGVKTFSQLDRIVCPVLQIAGEHEHVATRATKYSMELEASKMIKAEPPVIVEDPSGHGFSHLMLLEEGGLEAMMKHLTPFYEKHG